MEAVVNNQSLNYFIENNIFFENMTQEQRKKLPYILMYGPL